MVIVMVKQNKSERLKTDRVFFEAKGLTVRRFTNVEVERNIEGVMARLEEFIAKERKSDLNHSSPLCQRGNNTVFVHSPS